MLPEVFTYSCKCLNTAKSVLITHYKCFLRVMSLDMSLVEFRYLPGSVIIFL